LKIGPQKVSKLHKERKRTNTNTGKQTTNEKTLSYKSIQT